MKDVINQVKKDNGNQWFSNKDLLFYLVGKVDGLDRKIDNNLNLLNEKIEKKLDKKSFLVSISLIVTSFFTILGGGFMFMYKIMKGGV